ncbi:alpha/beta hydrolase [Cryobacterium sp. SO2]|uniref:alpha/beta hydrolase n=1 Tax=Cryobacterium sp. SO2 TaxID=1897060 RepID=UPI00223E379F|nr:alpha/beta hydrolase [Cryobacterium sp. SO2]WEO76988.1 alpha/beta hydrolase [Cryobacterium sp. SO2]
MTRETASGPIDATVDGPHGPVPVRRYAPTGTTARPPIVWVHGGGFFKGDLDLPETHEVARALAAAGFPVVTVDYRLATVGPGLGRRGIRYPVPVDDVVAVLRAVQLEYPDGVILGGASAGACLAAGAVLRLAADGAPPICGVFLAYGFFHASLPPRSLEVLGRLRGRRKYTHLPTLLNLTNRNYAGTAAALAEPFAFPGGHPLHAFPPALLLDAESDSMRASGEQFARELTAAAVPVEYHVLPGTVHAFLNRPHDPGFGRAIDLIGVWAAGIAASAHPLTQA